MEHGSLLGDVARFAQSVAEWPVQIQEARRVSRVSNFFHESQSDSRHAPGPISLASSPTDRVQIGQAGTRSARSTPDSLMRRATSFIAGSSRLALPIKPKP